MISDDLEKVDDEQKTFVQSLTAMFARLDNVQMNVEMIDTDVYYIWSADRSVCGFINLRSTSFTLKRRQLGRLFDDGAFLVKNCTVSRRNVILDKTSINLVDVGKKSE